MFNTKNSATEVLTYLLQTRLFLLRFLSVTYIPALRAAALDIEAGRIGAE